MSTTSDGQTTLGFLGGTGPHGRGLATRLAAAGYPVWIGSRERDRAAEVADELRQPLPSAHLSGGDNHEVAERASVVFVTVPYQAQQQLLAPLADAVADKIVVSVANPLRFDARGPMPVPVDDGSAAQECQRLLPDARVVSGFQNVSAVELAALDRPLAGHVLLCGDDADAKSLVAAVARAIPDLQPLDAGPLRLSGVVEDLTAVLLSVNRRYKVHSGIQLTGLPAS